MGKLFQYILKTKKPYITATSTVSTNPVYKVVDQGILNLLNQFEFRL